MRKKSLRTAATPAKRIAGKKRRPGALSATVSSIVDPPPAKGTEREHIGAALRASEELRKSEERHRLTFQSSSLPMWIYDSKTLRFLAVNRAATMHYGYSEAEFMGMTIRDIRPEEDLPSLEDALNQLEPGKTSRAEWRHRTKSGEIRAVEVASDSIFVGGREARLVVANDITHRKHAEEARALALALLRATLESTADGILAVGLDRRIESFNQTFAEMWRIPAEVLATGDSVLALGYVQDQLAEPERFLESVAYMYDHPSEETFDVLEFRDGRVFERFSRPMLVDGYPCGRVLSYRDVTERQGREKELTSQRAELTEAHRLLQSIIDTSPARIFWKDRASRYLGCNPAYARDAGAARPEDVVGKNDFQLFWKEQAEDYRAEDRRIIESGIEMLSYEGEIPTADGRTLWVRGSKVPLRGEGGEIIGVVGTYEDISENRSAEQAIRAEKEISEAMLDSLPGIFFLFDQAGRFLRWNRILETMTGYSAAEIAAMTPLDFFAGEDRELIEKSIRTVFEKGSMAVEAVLISKSRKEIPHYFAARRISWMGVPCCIGTGIDITARKSLEAALDQAQKMEAVGQLAGGVAHDFNNLLGVILGYGELALSEVEQDHPVARHLAEMLKATKRGAALTSQLQAFGRKQILQPKSLDLNLLVREAGKMLGRVIGEHVDLVDRLAPYVGTIRADPNQIDQILLNLAVNARDAMPGGGTLTVETANVELGEERAAAHAAVAPGRYVRLSVADTGVGMSEETRRRIFEPFFTTKPVGQGTGMGLATVYGIVKQSDGYIAVESEPDHGSTFEIFFPRLDEMAEAPTPAAPFDVAVGGTESILLVEDNVALREVTRRRLEERGYTVLQAEDGEAALTLAGGHGGAIDLLLTDVVMPKLGGVELARRLGSLLPGIRVLYMSGYTDDKILEHGAPQEGVALLTKPFTRDQLANAVREALDRPGFGRAGS